MNGRQGDDSHSHPQRRDAQTSARARELVRSLSLSPHREGGYFREVFRAGNTVTPDDSRGRRSALTAIYYLLETGDQSRFHQLRSDEVWHHYEGDTLIIWITAPDLREVRELRLGPLQHGAEPVACVPAGSWLAARSLGAYTLVGCTVGPGFEFEDFAMLADHPNGAEELRRRRPDLAELI